MALSTDFKDDILNESVNSKRKYNVIHNDDGTESYEDVTSYSQTGSRYGAAEVIEEREAINQLQEDVSSLNSALEHVNNLIWDSGYVESPYYFGAAIGDNYLVITSDGALWLVQSMSDTINILRLNESAQSSLYRLSGNTNDRVVTVRADGSGAIRVLRIRFIPRYS